MRITIDLAVVPTVVVGIDHHVSAFTSDIVDLLLDHVEIGRVEVAVDGVRREPFHLDVQTERIEPLRDEGIILFDKVSPPSHLKSLQVMLVFLTVLRVGKT